MNRNFLWALLGSCSLILWGMTACEKERPPSFLGDWSGTFLEYETQQDSVVLVQEWLFKMDLKRDGTGAFGRYKPISWKYDKEEKAMTIIILDNTGGAYPDLENRFEVVENTNDHQIWRMQYEGRPRIINGEEVLFPVERIWRLDRRGK